MQISGSCGARDGREGRTASGCDELTMALYDSTIAFCAPMRKPAFCPCFYGAFRSGNGRTTRFAPLHRSRDPAVATGCMPSAIRSKTRIDDIARNRFHVADVRVRGVWRFDDGGRRRWDGVCGRRGLRMPSRRARGDALRRVPTRPMRRESTVVGRVRRRGLGTVPLDRSPRRQRRRLGTTAARRARFIVPEQRKAHGGRARQPNRRARGLHAAMATTVTPRANRQENSRRIV